MQDWVKKYREENGYKWWIYPKNLYPDSFPWWIIIWRVIWIVPVYASTLLMCFFIMMGYGINNAKEAWDRIV